MSPVIHQMTITINILSVELATEQKNPLVAQKVKSANALSAFQKWKQSLICIHQKLVVTSETNCVMCVNKSAYEHLYMYVQLQ